MGLGLAFRAFFGALFNSDAAAKIESALSDNAPALPEKPDKSEKKEKKKAAPARSDAITLLATLQREARFLDIVKEPLDGYTDAQIGAAARDVLRDCGATLDRLFGIESLVDDEEGSQIETPEDFDANQYRLTGKVEGDPPYKGALAHHGWSATKCDLPQWNGSKDAALIIAPAELEIS